jgi:hypothetical protein
MQKSGGIRAGFQGLEGMVVPVKIKALADLRSSDYRWIAGIADMLVLTHLSYYFPKIALPNPFGFTKLRMTVLLMMP